MVTVRKANERGHANHGWLDTYHTFSFSNYYDPEHMGFRALRVINEDVVAPGRGFGTHPHSDMEIVTYVLKGALQHKDSMGNGSVLKAGEVQRMSAGSGITHSEFNASKDEPVHLYQIWLQPEKRGVEPSYEERTFDPAGKQGQWQTIASRDARDASMRINQDATLSLAALDGGSKLEYPLEQGRHAWLQVIRGEVSVNGTKLQTSDAAAVSNESTVKIEAGSDAEVMLFDLA
ncbi:MAG: pirin family protein [Candidatus Hydrogenedentes bacterium]|nr:pirin family protein [Candidatus Hydrogenedentota bacterium]